MLDIGREQRPSWQRWLGLGKQSGPLRLAADAANLPIKSRSTALIWSNLLLHWLDDPLPALAEAHRVLEVGGLLMFSTLGPDSLKELRIRPHPAIYRYARSWRHACRLRLC